MTTRSRKTRIAVAGAGYIGLAHIGALRASPTCELAAIVDPSPAGKAAAAEAGVPHFASLDALIAKDRPEGVVLATPNVLHEPQALHCLDAGLAVLLEKPIASTVVAGTRIVEAVASKRGRLLVGHHRAHSPIMAKAVEVVRSGRLGRLVAITGSAMFLKPDSYFADAPWRREIGGGPILINLIHEIHNLRMLCGDIASVQAIASNAVRGHPVEDTVAIVLRFANGALGTFMLSDTAASPRSWEQTSQENKAYASCDDEDCYVVAGTHGTLAVPTMRTWTYPPGAERSWWKPFETGRVDMVRDDPIVLQMEHFGAVVRGEAEPIVSARDGLENLRVTEAIAEAAKTGCTVDTTSA
jgi:predicted dehydrogenase